MSELERSFAARNARYRAEALARVPLEKARMKAEYLDKTGKLSRRVQAVKVETIGGDPTVR